LKNNIFFLAFGLALISGVALADETVITTDGRYIWLKANGTYQVVPPQPYQAPPTLSANPYGANPYATTPYGGYAYPAYGPPSGQPGTGQHIPVPQVPVVQAVAKPVVQPAGAVAVDEDDEDQGLIQWLLSDDKAEKTHNPKR